MPIQISEVGNRFIAMCLSLYQGDGYFLLLFAGAMLCLLFLKDRESKVLKALVWPYLLILALTVYNVLIMRVFIDKLGLSGEYYRFFWLLPIGVVLPYVCVRLVERGKKRAGKALVSLVLAAAIILCGVPAWSRKLPFTSNAYRIPDDMVIVCDIVKTDAEREHLEDVGVFFDFDLNLLITQYDPSLRVVIPYQIMMDTVNTGKTVDDTDNVWLNSRIRLIELLVLDREGIPHEEFMSALNVTETAYVVYDLNGPNHGYLLAAGLAEIGRTENYVIYKYGWYFDRLHRQRGYIQTWF